MRRPAFCICENKDLVGNPEDRFSHNEAQVFVYTCSYMIGFIIIFSFHMMRFVEIKLLQETSKIHMHLDQCLKDL